MNDKPRPNHERYVRILKSQTPEQRLCKAFELSAFAKALFRAGLRRRFPELSPSELHQLFLTRLGKCHNKNF